MTNPTVNGFYAVCTIDPIPIILEWDGKKWLHPDGTMREFESVDDIIGYILIKEPEYKPLLADAKKGDLCQRRDGKWVQIDAIRNNGNKWSMYEAEGHSYHESGNSVLSELLHTSLDIIHTEPLAPEGTAEWAWQMRLLGHGVSHRNIHYFAPLSESEKAHLDLEKINFLSMITSKHETDGWQIYYPKPEPKPKFADVKVDDWVEIAKTPEIKQVGQVKHYTSATEFVVHVNNNSYVYNTDGFWVHENGNSNAYQIIRILKPSEVRVKITLEGTVHKSENYNHMFWLRNSDQRSDTLIRYKDLDPATAEIVRELVAKQQKGE